MNKKKNLTIKYESYLAKNITLGILFLLMGIGSFMLLCNNTSNLEEQFPLLSTEIISLSVMGINALLLFSLTYFFNIYYSQNLKVTKTKEVTIK